MTEAYSIFKEEAQCLDPEYSPQRLNTEGWQPTQSARKALFPLTSLILCFLHVFIKIRDRTKKKFKSLFQETADKLWECSRPPNKTSFANEFEDCMSGRRKAMFPRRFSIPLINYVKTSRNSKTLMICLEPTGQVI